MKRFKYRLQALLKVKEHIEKERQKALAESVKKVRDQQLRLEAVDNYRAATTDRSREKARKRFSVAEMLIISRYLHKLKRDTLVGRELLRVLRREEDGKRHDLIEAARERRKYERLKEIQQEKHLKNVEATLTKESDENAISSYRHRHKKVTR